MTNEHTSLEKYTSHTLFERVSKGLCVRGELETEQTASYWPQVPLSLAALLSYSAGLLNRRSWGPKPSAGSWFSLPRTATRTPTNWLQLTESNSGTWLYNCLTSTCFSSAPNSTTSKRLMWYLRYLRPDEPVSWLTAGSKVNMLHKPVSLNFWSAGRKLVNRNQSSEKYLDEKNNNNKKQKQKQKQKQKNINNFTWDGDINRLTQIHR